MKRFLIVSCMLALAASAAEEPGALRKMKPPKGVTLTPEEQKMLEEANRALESGHKLLLEAHDPAAAVEQLRRALAIANQLKTLKPELLMTGSLTGRGTPEDKIETEGGMERIIEIAANMAVEAPADVDNGLHKRKVAKLAADETRKLAQEQKQLTEQIAQAQQTQQTQPQQQDQQGGAQKQRNKGVQQNVLLQQTSAAQAQPEQQQQAQTQPQNQRQQDGGGEQKQQNQADPKQAAQNQPPNAQGKPEPNQSAQQNGGAPQDPQNKTEQNQAAQQNGGGQAGPEQLARNQENIARALHKLATALTPAKQGDPADARASQAFRKAGDEAARTADLLRHNQLDSAAANSRQVERAIGEALTAAGVNAGQRQAEAIAALQKQLEAAQAAQQKILGQTQQIQRNADGSAASDELQKDRARALAIEQGKLKPQLDSVQRTLAELGEAGAGDGKPNSAQNAAREEVANAANELQKGRAKQALVNAAMRLANGEPASAAAAMAQTQAALKAAQHRLDAAANALAGNSAALQQEYRQLQQAAAALRRLQRDAQAGEAGAPDKSAVAQPNKGGEPAPATAAQQDPKSTGNPAADQDKDGVAISATWGGMLNRSAQQVNAELQKLAPALASVNADAAKQIGALAGRSTAFERDREGSLAQVASLLKEVEKIELALAKKMAGEEERRALNSYRKDDIPQPYRKAVAAYYEELSKDK